MNLEQKKEEPKVEEQIEIKVSEKVNEPEEQHFGEKHICPECGHVLGYGEGCFICLNCGYSGCA